MNVTLNALFSFSVSIAAVIGWVRFKNIHPTYYPFLLFIWIGFINEIISFLVIQNGHSNNLNNNLFCLLQAVLLTFQFKQWRLFEPSNLFYYIISISFCLLWLLESFVFGSAHRFNSYFMIIHSFVIVLMSISTNNKIMVHESRNILKNSVFIICSSFIIYFTYAVLVEAFWLYGIYSSTEFQKLIIRILTYINLFTNLLYALAILWMPRKKIFTLPL